MRTHKTWRDSGLKWTDMVGKETKDRLDLEAPDVSTSVDLLDLEAPSVADNLVVLDNFDNESDDETSDDDIDEDTDEEEEIQACLIEL